MRSHIRIIAALLLSAMLFPANARSAATSTATVRTSLDAVEVMSLHMGVSLDRAVQDHLYDGNRRLIGISGGAVKLAAVSGGPAPAAKYTGPAAGAKVLMGTVPQLPASRPAAALTVNGLGAKALGKAAAGKSAAENPSVLQKIGTFFSDAYSAVKSWVSRSAAWTHDKIMGKGRPLTAEEIAAMKPVFGDSVDYTKVRIVTGDNLGLWGKILTSGNAAVTWGKTIYFPNGADGKSQYNLNTKAYWLAHEMTHEYQYQKYGWGYVPSSVWGQLTKGQAFYEYQLESGKGFRKYNVEQQADLVGHYYQILNGTRSATPEELAVYQQVMKDQGLFKGTGSN